jgi:hypothetical protein
LEDLNYQFQNISHHMIIRFTRSQTFHSSNQKLKAENVKVRARHGVMSALNNILSDHNQNLFTLMY